METPGTYAGKREDRDYEPEHLPPLLEDEENVSLADVLSLRDSCLSEQEVWAVCVECVLALQSIRPTHLFHTLCITPDTLAFNAHGNVCFMEQLSDDPEGSFVPPEFDNTGSTFEGHVYSLGSTLSAALNFVIEPELEVEMGDEVRRLLEQMQEEKPEDRALLQDIVSLAEARLSHTSSAAVCRKLSSIGRRVLSIESVSTFQDGQEGSWEARWQHPKPRRPLARLSSADNSRDVSSDKTASSNGLSRQQICGGWDSSLWDEDSDCGGGRRRILMEELDCRSHNGSPVRRRAQQRPSRVRGALNRSCSVPDSNNPPSLVPVPHGDISIPVSDLTEIGADEDASCESDWGGKHKMLDRGKSCETYAYAGMEDCWNVAVEERPATQGIVEAAEDGNSGEQRESNRNDVPVSPSPHPSPRDPQAECDSPPEQSSLEHRLYARNNHMTKSMLCLNEETQDEWISLRELLSRCGHRLSVNELWALCYTCLASLQTYTNFPAYLSLDTVYIGCEGEVLFLKPRNIATYDAFYLAPEYQEHGIVTDKVCVYGVAAILWAAAKFNLSPNQKLAMPQKLKRLLLEMAKRTPIERPSIAMAKKSCRDYLTLQGTDVHTVWNKLINRVHQPASDLTEADIEKSADSPLSSFEDSAQISRGFVPMATESRLAPVPGPVPHSYPVQNKPQLPEAFTSMSTHFTPIVLTSEGESEDESQTLQAANEGSLDGFTVHEHSEDESRRDAGLPAETLNSRANRANPHDSPSTPSCVSTPDVLCQRVGVSLPQQLSSLCSGCSVFNNYLLHQDSMTGRLTLKPVGVQAPEFSTLFLLDSNLPRVPGNLPEQTTIQEHADSQTGDCLSGPTLENGPPQCLLNGSPTVPQGPQTNSSRPLDGQTNSETKSSREEPVLEEVIDLLKGEFEFDGFLENGQEDVVMGEYIFSLKDMQYHHFASVVKEKFGDLYWEDDLLAVLHCLVGYSTSALSPNEEPPPNDLKRAVTSPPVPSVVKSEIGSLRRLDLNGNIRTPGRHAGDAAEVATAESGGVEEEKNPECDAAEPASQRNGREAAGGSSEDMEGSVSEVAEGGDHSAGGSDESPSEADFAWAAEEQAEPDMDGQMSPELAEDMEDVEFLGSSERLLVATSATERAGLNFDPSWALAFFGEGCFGPEVVQYAADLGQHRGSACLDVKTQELQQQLMIETKNLKKTRNFFQKLIQQERKNKGSDNKLMLSKLKSQLEELRSKVAFLDCVKKYLKVLSVDQWGLEISLLPSLAACGPNCLDLHSSEDAAVLSFGTSKEMRGLQAGSPRGLMAYLYARSVASEGYIQQFLYVYRYFCTPQHLLQFITEKFSRAVRDGADVSGDKAKVFHRSLDLLQAWLTNCRLVDFAPKSSLAATLEDFLTTEVVPVDSRGESLLASLDGTAQTSGCLEVESSVGVDEGNDSLSVQLSTEDLGRKLRISGVMDGCGPLPKEKSFSIAAALPVPCYGSLVGDVSVVCLHSEQRLPLSRNDSSAQHIAQQLTLMQQDIFQQCHPVHFLNSRVQGVRDNVWSPNKNVSPLIPPADGSKHLACDRIPADSSLQHLLAYADSITNWISAEVVMCDSVKAQVSLLSKFLWMGKYCYETRNFATAMQILTGLENVTVRQLPAWKHLASKVCEILEELRAVQVFLKSDDLCLMGGEQTRRRPTLPAAHILAMHIQQLEKGAFTLTNGAFKWTKLRSIAKVVSQVHAFQESLYTYGADPELQTYLRLRIARFGISDGHPAPAEDETNLQPSTERQARTIQDTLRRVKANFQ